MNQEIRKDAMYQAGRAAAQELQVKSADMTGTQLYDATQEIPDFQAAKATQNMLTRNAGMKDGFVCKSSAGRVVKLLQPYDSDTYTQEPEDLPSQWGFVWSDNPNHALPFVSIATSPFMIGNVCSENGKVYRSTIDGNVWAPSEYPTGWEEVTDFNYTEPDPDEPEVPEPDPVPEPEEPTPEEPQVDDFKRPTGSHDAYNTGDRVRFEGLIYESTIDGNTWSPAEYPAGWKLVEV